MEDEDEGRASDNLSEWWLGVTVEGGSWIGWGWLGGYSTVQASQISNSHPHPVFEKFSL